MSDKEKILILTHALEFYARTDIWYSARLYLGCPDGNTSEYGSGEGIQHRDLPSGLHYPCHVAMQALRKIEESDLNQPIKPQHNPRPPRQPLIKSPFPRHDAPPPPPRKVY